MDIMTALFDEEEVMRRYINNTVKTAVNEEAESIAKKMLALHTISYEDISKCTGLSLSEIKELDALQTV